MNKNSIVQIISKKNKSLNGCLGFISLINNNEVTINIYYPVSSDKNAFVKKFILSVNDIKYIGEPNIKPL